MEHQPLDTGFVNDGEVRIIRASTGKRFANLIVDMIVVYLFTGVISIGALAVGLISEEFIFNLSTTEEYLYSWFIFVFIYFGFEGITKGKTIGKYITKTRAVSEDGSELSVGQALGRSFCRLIPFEAFSFLGESPQGWHDSIPRTLVIDEQQSLLPEKNLFL